MKDFCRNFPMGLTKNAQKDVKGLKTCEANLKIHKPTGFQLNHFLINLTVKTKFESMIIFSEFNFSSPLLPFNILSHISRGRQVKVF